MTSLSSHPQPVYLITLKWHILRGIKFYNSENGWIFEWVEIWERWSLNIEWEEWELGALNIEWLGYGIKINDATKEALFKHDSNYLVYWYPFDKQSQDRFTWIEEMMPRAREPRIAVTTTSRNASQRLSLEKRLGNFKHPLRTSWGLSVGWNLW